MCNAAQPATINLLSRNVGGPRIPIKCSSMYENVCCVLTHKLFKSVSYLSTIYPLRAPTFSIPNQYPIKSMWGHAVTATNGMAVKLGSTHITNIDNWPEDTFSSAVRLSA